LIGGSRTSAKCQKATLHVWRRLRCGPAKSPSIIGELFCNQIIGKAELRGRMPLRFNNNPTHWAKRRETPLAGLSLLDDPGHWRERAEKTRTMAEKVLDIESRFRLMKIADEYNRLAKRAEKHMASNRRH
jgi:hypothetical protein